MDKDQGSERLLKVFLMNTGYPGNPPNPPLEKGGRRGDFWNCLAVTISPLSRSFAELYECLSVSFSFLRNDPCGPVFIRVPLKFFGCGYAALCPRWLNSFKKILHRNKKGG